MNGTTTDKIRNFVIAGHAGCGKTTLSDVMLFKSGIGTRVGSVDVGTSVSDFRPEEQDRKCSMYAAPLNCTWQGHKFFFVDTPGYADFFGETLAAISIADMVLVVVDAAAGVEMGTVRAWKAAREYKIPRAFFINGLDRDQADFAGTLAAIQETYGATTCIPFVIPVGEKASFASVVQVLRSADIPAAAAASVEQYREALMDTIAESDEALMDKYLEGEALTDEEISRGLHAAILAGDIVPVFAGSASTEVGVQELMNGIVNLFPNPGAGRSISLASGESVICDGSGDPSAFAFKSVSDPFIGQLTFFRVFSGVFRSDTEALNLATGQKERLGSLMVLNGKEQENISEAGPGAIVAVAKLKNTHVNQTLVTKSGTPAFAPIEFPKPTTQYAVYPVKKGEDEKVNGGLQRFCEEDPTLSLRRDAETHETILSGMGDQQIQNVIKRLKEATKIEVDLRTPSVPYRETITSVGTATYRHKKQTGGHGQFAEVHLRVEPLPDGEFEFANEVVGGNIPKNFIPAIEKGVTEALVKGPLANCKVISLKAIVFDGKHHPVDSSGMAFKIASRGAFREAVKSAKPQLLEPIMKLRIMFPDEYMGDISGDLSSRRGRILGMDREEGLQVVIAEVPLVEAFCYATQLRSLSHGRGTFEMDFDRYEVVPSNIAQEVAAAASAEEDDV